MPVRQRENSFLMKTLAPKNLFIQKVTLLIVVSSLSYFFSTHQMLPLCLLFIPFIYLLYIAPIYARKNTTQEINQQLSKLSITNNEIGNYLTIFLKILWPHMFSQERVEQFKTSLQNVLDNQKLPYVDRVILTEIQLGDTAPQITFVKIPEKLFPADRSLIFELQAIYYPSLVLNAVLKVNSAVDVKVSFNNLTVKLDTIMQFEFKQDPNLQEIPFWTALDFSLTQPPSVTGFDLTVFNMTSVFNREDLKRHMSQAAAKALWSLCGMPYGFLWERVTGAWKIATVHGKEKMKRSSLKHRDLIRISLIKQQANEYIKKYNIPMPLALISTAYADKSTTTHFFKVLADFSDSYNIEAFDNLIDQIGRWETSDDELMSIMCLTYDFVYDWFKSWAQKQISSKKGITKEAETRIGKIMTYINFLMNQKKNHPEVAEEMEIEKKVDDLFLLVSNAQKVIASGK